MLSTSHVIFPLNLTIIVTHDVATIAFAAIPQQRKLRTMEINWLAQSHTVIK